MRNPGGWLWVEGGQDLMLQSGTALSRDDQVTWRAELLSHKHMKLVDKPLQSQLFWAEFAPLLYTVHTTLPFKRASFVLEAGR
jgi:hypothetical protein